MRNKKIVKWLIILFILIIIGFIVFLLFSRNNMSKKNKIGNNSSSQEIVNYILNISSYTAKIEVEVDSNKNKNKYVLKQEYKGPDINSQEVIEPTNISGTKIIRNGANLRIENTDLNLKSIFENYSYISDNVLDLSCFIKEYKEDEKSIVEEKNDQIIMKTSNKVLYIDRSNANPIKMEIRDNNKNITIYILYNEVNVNS